MWPQLTNIETSISDTIKSRSNTKVASKLNPWVRIISGAVVSGVQGLVISSNNDFKLFKAADQNFGTIYGSKSESGALGYDLANKNAIGAGGEGRGFRPSPIITNLNSKEGKDQISRELELTIKCFSKDQMELLQSFLMEPGYNLCVEWGFNTARAMTQMINTGGSLESILNSVADRCLNQDNIHAVRKSSGGEYDIFLGFIVGGTVTSDGESFILTIKCKGAPGLPTFLQTHRKTQQLGADGKVIELPTVQPFNPSELLNADSNSQDVIRKRRFKYMFNELPAEKQIKEIKDLVETGEYGMFDFINFDEVVNQQLTSFETSGGWDLFNWAGQKEITVGNSSLKKEALFPDYSYISMDLCAKILNRNGGLTSLKIRDKEVKVMIDIANAVIGAFPNMFAIKAEKLIIPGAALPPFKKYFLSTVDIQQSAGGTLSEEGPIDYSLGFNGEIRFPQNTALDKFGHKEDANYWGYLKHIYVNFEMFKSKLNQPNKTIREIFLDILNELSSGVNSFWNFQIVETIVTKEKPVTGLKEGDIVISVIDENWVGKNTQPAPPTKFVHAGIYSAFTSAELDISIPQDMTSMLVSKRLALATNPESAIVNTGELFNSDVDLFMKKVTLPPGGEDGTEPEPAPQTEVEKQEKELEDIDKIRNELRQKNKDIDVQINQIIKDYSELGARSILGEVGATLVSGIAGLADTPEERRRRAEAEAAKDKLEAERDAKIAELKKQKAENEKAADEWDDKYDEKEDARDEAIEKAEEDALAAEQAKLTSNFEKIAIFPNPLMVSVNVTSDSIKSQDTFAPGASLRIYTLNDGNYFDRLRNDAFSPQDTGKNKRLSHPLPIKYNFTTIGVSGLRRGDMFNILGIPDKYEKHGMFQITQIEHELSGMEWKTSVTGEYRQFNS